MEVVLIFYTSHVHISYQDLMGKINLLLASDDIDICAILMSFCIPEGSGFCLAPIDMLLQYVSYTFSSFRPV